MSCLVYFQRKPASATKRQESRHLVYLEATVFITNTLLFQVICFSHSKLSPVSTSLRDRSILSGLKVKLGDPHLHVEHSPVWDFWSPLSEQSVPGISWLCEVKWKSHSCVWLIATPQSIYSPWNSPDQNTRVGSHSLLKRIFSTQVSCIACGFFTSWATREAHPDFTKCFPLIKLQKISGIGSHLETSCGEGNGTPLQYSRLENPMDGGAW